MMEDKAANKPAGTHDDLSTPDLLDDVGVLMELLQSAAATGSDIIGLLQLELRLAVIDIKRLLLLAKLFIPMLVLSWMSLSSVLAWHVYLLNASISQGLWFLCIFQFLGLLCIGVGLKTYQKSLTLPLTRQHIRQILKGKERES